MKAEELFFKVRVDTSEVEENVAKMQRALDQVFTEWSRARGQLAEVSAPDQTAPLALLGAYAAGTRLHRPVSRRSLLTGGLR